MHRHSWIRYHTLLVPRQPSPNNFSILYFDARSTLSKLRVVVAAQNPSIVCISSHGFCEVISDLKIFDRNRHGGGVLIYIHASLTWEVLLRGSNDLVILSLSVNSLCSFSKHCISVLYCLTSFFFD